MIRLFILLCLLSSLALISTASAQSRPYPPKVCVLSIEFDSSANLIGTSRTCDGTPVIRLERVSSDVMAEISGQLSKLQRQGFRIVSCQLIPRASYFCTLARD